MQIYIINKLEKNNLIHKVLKFLHFGDYHLILLVYNNRIKSLFF